MICFNERNRRFGNSFTICIDETSVIAQTCKTSYDGVSLCAFRCANETVKRVEGFCHCHGVILYIHAFKCGCRLEENRFPQDKQLIPHEKNFLQEFFSKNAKKVLRETRAKLSSLAQILLTRQPRSATEKLFRRIHPYLSYLLDVTQYH